MAAPAEPLLWSLLHDMGSPLQMAAIALGMAGEGRQDADASRDALEAVTAMQRRLAALRRIAVREHPADADVALEVPLEEALAMLGPDAPQLASHPRRTVRCDPDALAIVLQNLLQNASRHADPAAPDVRVEARPRPGGGTVVAVVNNGDAMPDGALARLLAPGAQNDEAGVAGRRVGQAGLGLAIAAGLLAWHGTTLVQVPVQKGTRLEFTLGPGHQSK